MVTRSYVCLLAVLVAYFLFAWFGLSHPVADAAATTTVPQSALDYDVDDFAESDTSGATSPFAPASHSPVFECTNDSECGSHGDCKNNVCKCERDCKKRHSVCGQWYSSAQGGICDAFQTCQVGRICSYCAASSSSIFTARKPIWGAHRRCVRCSEDTQCSYFKQVNLLATAISNTTNANVTNVDENLVAPFGMVVVQKNDTSTVYVANSGNSKVTVYSYSLKDSNSTDTTAVLSAAPNSTISVPHLNSSNSTASNSTASNSTSTSPTGPTGVVFNSDSSIFRRANSTSSASVIVATLEGTIAAYFKVENNNNNSTSNSTTTNESPPPEATIVANRTNAVYTGLAMYSVPSNNSAATYLLAANIANKTIDVFDSSFKFVRAVSAPSNVSADLAPFNVQTMSITESNSTNTTDSSSTTTTTRNLILVTFASFLSANTTGSGGMVMLYDFANDTFTVLIDSTTKNVTTRDSSSKSDSDDDSDAAAASINISNNTLNAPWGMAIAPSTWVKYWIPVNDNSTDPLSTSSSSPLLLVGSLGDGTISLFNLTTASSASSDGNSTSSTITAAFISKLLDHDYLPMRIQNLLSLVPVTIGEEPRMLFTAAPLVQGEQQGLVGEIVPVSSFCSAPDGCAKVE